MRCRYALLWTLAIAFTLAGAAQAEGFRCVLTADDFQPVEVEITKLDGETIQFTRQTDNTSATLPAARVVRLEGAAGPRGETVSRPNSFVLSMTDGQRVTGRPLAIEGDDLRWQSPGQSARQVPLKRIESIVRGSPTDASARGATARRDELILENGDVVSGVIQSATADTVQCVNGDNQPIDVDWANVRAARFAAIGSPSPAEPAAFRVRLRDGSVLDFASLAFEPRSGFTAESGVSKTAFPAADVLAVEHRAGGTFNMLADLVPASATYAPYFPSNAQASPDRSGGVVTIAGHVARASILAKPRSILRWNLDGSATTFRTRFGMPDGRPLADVDVRIRLDDAIAFERKHVKAGQLSDVLSVPLGVAKSITLEVDFGDQFDVQDDLYWLEPALLKR